MVLARRVLAVSLVIIFPMILLITLLLLRINATVLEPGFYTRTLERVDAYNFLYDEAIPLAVRESGVDLSRDIPLGLDLTPEGVSAYVKHVLPPEWLQENVSVVVHQVVPYMTGRTDTFTIVVRVDDRVEAAGEVVRDIVANAEVHAFLIEDLIRPELARNQRLLEDLPFGMRLTVDQVVEGIVLVVPEDWLKAQAIGVVDEVVPYITAQADGFRVVIPIHERTEVALMVLEGWLVASLDNGAYEYVLDVLVRPSVTSALARGVTFPYGVTLTEGEVMDSVGRAIDRDWMADVMRDVVHGLGAYLSGQSDTLRVAVPIEDRTRLAAQDLVAVLDAKLEDAYNALPPCTPGQLIEFGLSLTRLPNCSLPGLTYDDVRFIVGYSSEDELVERLVGAMPRTIELSEDVLLGGIGANTVANLRTLLREGYVFTDGELHGLLTQPGNPEATNTLEDVRGYMRDGFVLTEADLHTAMGSDYEQFESVRRAVGTARTWAFLLLLPPLLLVAAVGFLGGTSWWTRLAWAGAPLVVGGVIVAAASGVVAGPLREMTDPALRSMDVPPAIQAWAIRVRDELVRAFVMPITIQGVVAMVLGIGAIAGGIYMERRDTTPRDALGIPLEFEEAEAEVEMEVARR